MNIKQLKDIMKEVNAPNEFELVPHNLQHPLYWVWKIEGVRIKTLFSKLDPLRKPSARFDVFINGVFIRDIDYKYEQVGNDFHIKFIRAQFPEFDRFGNVYTIDENDEVKLEGDVEKFK